MGFFDKIKNMFTEEVEEDEVRVEKIKNEVTHVAIESPNAKKEEFEEEMVENFKFRTEEKINKPVFFDDNDFEDLKLETKPEVKKPIVKEKEIYKVKEEEKEEKKVFKPTPIISPVYGILNKNYHKEDIVSRQEVKSKSEIDEVSIDSIRNKAYGTLEDELENTLFGSNSILFKKDDSEELETGEVQLEEINDDVLTNLTDDISKELDELLLKKEKYTDEEIKTSIKNDENFNEDDLLGFIDSTLYKNGDDE